MSVLVISLAVVFLFYGLLMAVSIGIIWCLPKSFLSEPAKAILTWLPPFVRGDALRDWAATVGEQSVQRHLAGQRTGESAIRLATEVEEIAMQAMVPLAGPAELERVVACPETGQGLVGVTAPEVLTIAAYIRKNKSPAEQKRIHNLAVENARIIASTARGDGGTKSLPCALQGHGHVCCAYAARPLHCRPLHAIGVAKALASCAGSAVDYRVEAQDTNAHEQTVAQGIEIGMTRALKSAGLDASLYELNSALATALATPDAAERWARGESVFHDPLPAITVRRAGSDETA